MIRGAAIFFIAWCVAYGTVKAECEHMGSFLVGTKVFECKARQ